MKNSQGKIRKMGKEIEKGEVEGWIVDRPKSQQEMGTQIDRLDDEFPNGAISGGIHELERDGDKNYGRLRGIWPGGEYLGRHPIPKVAEEDEKEK